jgi:hypothetical protein
MTHSFSEIPLKVNPIRAGSIALLKKKRAVCPRK